MASGWVLVALLLVGLFERSSNATPPTPQSIRIQWDLDSIKTALPTVQYDQLVYVVNSVSTYLSTFIRTYPQAFTIPNTAKCGTANAPSNATGSYSDKDLIILVGAAALTTGYNSTGLVCYYDTAYIKRPVLGQILLEKNLFQTPSTTWLSEPAVYNAVLHATLQVMVFNYASFSNYWDWTPNSAYPLASVILTNSGQDYMILPKVLSFGKEFFRCYSSGFKGVAVKYDSTKTYAYWDRKFNFFDILTIDHSVNPVVTMFTVKLLNSCGWYDALPEFGVHTNWGYQTGCDLVGNIPSALGCTLTTSEYSFALKQETCSMDYKTKGSIFSADSYFQMDGCPIFKKTSVYTNKSLDCTNMNRTLVSDTLSILTQEYFGPDARCFVAKYKHINVQLQSADLVLLPVCQKFRCIPSNGTMKLFLYLDNQAVECPQSGDLSGSTVDLGLDLVGTIICPPPEIFCRAVGNLGCRNNCGGNGVCYQGKCVCFPGYFGDDCSTIGMGLNPLDVCIWPNTDLECKIKPQNECYFYCGSTLLATYVWAMCVSAFLYTLL